MISQSGTNMMIGAFGGFDPATLILPAFNDWRAKSTGLIVSNFNQSSRAAFDSGYASQVNNYDNFKGRTVFSIPLICSGETLAQGAAGNFVSSWQGCFQKIYNSRKGIEPNAIVRLPWEFNGNWQPWASTGKYADFIAMWRLGVNTARAIHPSFFKFSWCPNWQQDNPDPSYPGDSYVDYMDMDCYYDVNNGDDPDGQVAWDYKLVAPYGLNWLTAYAATHGKPLAMTEWGVNSNAGGATYINNIGPWFTSNSFAYQSYWESNQAFTGLLQNNQYPLAGAAYRKQFG